MSLFLFIIGSLIEWTSGLALWRLPCLQKVAAWDQTCSQTLWSFKFFLFSSSQTSVQKLANNNQPHRIPNNNLKFKSPKFQRLHPRKIIPPGRYLQGPIQCSRYPGATLVAVQGKCTGLSLNGWWYTVEDAGLCKLCTYVRSLHHDRNRLEEFAWNRIFDAAEWSSCALEMPIRVADFNTNQASANRAQSWRTTLYELWPFPGNLLNRGKLPI